jgi:hypothetical protein
MQELIFPQQKDIAEYQDVVQNNYPALEGAWCIINGLMIQIEKSGDKSTENHITMGGFMTTFCVVFLFLFLLR